MRVTHLILLVIALLCFATAAVLGAPRVNHPPHPAATALIAAGLAALALWGLVQTIDADSA